jgi:hypothetical protein
MAPKREIKAVPPFGQHSIPKRRIFQVCRQSNDLPLSVGGDMQCVTKIRILQKRIQGL